MTEFVTTPTEDWLSSELETCRSRLLISSPYVAGWLPNISSRVPVKAQRLLLTRADLRDFASGASDLDAVCTLADGGTEVISSHRLHAKVYIIDEASALITSANATFSGMRSNLEFGVVIRGSHDVNRAANLVLSGFEAGEAPQRWTRSDLETLREPVKRMRETLSPKLMSSDWEERALPDVNASSPLGRALREHLPGWTRLAIEGVQMQAATFNLDAFAAACAPLVAERFPNNRNVRPKLRQQLQRLRDLGLLEFLGAGNYRRNA